MSSRSPSPLFSFRLAIGRSLLWFMRPFLVELPLGGAPATVIGTDWFESVQSDLVHRLTGKPEEGRPE